MDRTRCRVRVSHAPYGSRRHAARYVTRHRKRRTPRFRNNRTRKPRLPRVKRRRPDHDRQRCPLVAPRYKSPPSPSAQAHPADPQPYCDLRAPRDMSLFLHTERLSNVGAMVLDRLRRVGESVVAIAGRATPSSSQLEDDLESVSRAYHDECDRRFSTPPRFKSPAPDGEPSTSQSTANEPPSQPSEEEEERRRHAAQMWSECRVKVRDFAYESKLPPVPPTRPRPIPLPYGGRRPLRRAWEECFGQEEDHFEEAEGREPKRRKLERTVTEPIPSSQNQPPSQLPGFGDLEDIHDASFDLGDSDNEFDTPGLDDGHQNDESLDVVFLDWADSGAVRPEGWIDTPPISPGGSYVPLPHAAIASRPASLMDIDTVDIPQEPTNTELEPSQEVEQTQIFEPSPLPVNSIAATSLLSSLTSLSSTPSSPPTPRLSRTHSRPRRTSLRDISMHYNSRPPTPPSPVPTPRYLLRNRAASKPGSPVPRTGARRLSGAASPSSRPPRKTRSSAAKRTTGSVKAAPPSKPVRRSPRNKSGRASRR